MELPGMWEAADLIGGQAETWTLEIRPLGGMNWLTSNQRMHRQQAATLARHWRALAFQAATKAQLPKGLARVRIDATITPRGERKRDPQNFQPTLKPIVDGLAGQAHNGAPAYGLVPDDDPRHVDGPYIRMGPRHPLGNRLPFVGLVHLVITELEAS